MGTAVKIAARREVIIAGHIIINKAKEYPRVQKKNYFISPNLRS
jgi:hypothetical protein